MRVLILSCNTGEGHNSSSKALCESFCLAGHSCETIDALQFFSKTVSKVLSGGHVLMYRRFPGLFRFGYRFFEKHPGLSGEKTPIYRFLTAGREELNRYLREGGYDTVVCTHVFAALMLTDVLKQHPRPMKTAFVATDYTCHPITKDSNLDLYFIPDASLSEDFRSPHIPDEKICAFGIPIRRAFYQHLDGREAKERFGVHPSHKHLVLMCGSMGCGPIRRLTSLLAEGLPVDAELTVVCGTNHRLERVLCRIYEKNSRVHIRGYVKEMSALMDSADLYLTKPGGLSVTEAAVKQLPMLYIDAVAGCEEHNRRYFTDLGGAKTAQTVKALASLSVRLLSEDDARLAMKEALRCRYSGAKNVPASDRIVQQMEKSASSSTV